MIAFSYLAYLLIVSLSFLGNGIVVDNDCFSSQSDCRKWAVGWYNVLAAVGVTRVMETLQVLGNWQESSRRLTSFIYT